MNIQLPVGLYENIIIQIKICAEYRDMLPRPRLVCQEPGLRPIGRSPGVPDKSAEGLEKQLGGLYKYCANNHMIVNETKTKVMCFGKCTEVRVKYNGVLVEHVNQYKYHGNILMSVRQQNQDVFANNYEYFCNQALKAIYCFRKKVNEIGVIPPKIIFYIFYTLVRPILTWRSDVWGISKKGLAQIDKVFCSLHVVYYMLNPKHVTRLFMGNVVGFHLAYSARSTPYVS